MSGYPAASNNTYIPALSEPSPVPTLDHIRKTGVIVAINPYRTEALVTYNLGLMVCFSQMTMNPDGSLGEIINRRPNQFVRVKQ